MHWVIQENLFNEEGYLVLLQALDRLGLPYSVHKVVPFTSQLIPEPEFPAGTKVSVMGATTMVRIAQERGWEPGAYFNDQYNMEVYRACKWGPHMLNKDAMFCAFQDVSAINVGSFIEDGVFFIRPVLDIKTFTGQCMSWPEFEEWQHRVVALGEDDGSSLRADTRVLVAKPKFLYAEYRIYMIGGEPVTGSQYRRGGRSAQVSDVEPDVLDFARERTFEWAPSRAFVMDIARTPAGLSIIEAGCFNAAGFYKADMMRVLEAVERLQGEIPMRKER